MSDRKRWSSVDAEQANALACLIEAGNRGDGGAACRLGDIYREEVVGLDGSSRMAFRWYSRSALAGNSNGQNNLGACYEHGFGCTQSYPKAVKWYRIAEAQGNGTATMNLGYCHLHGHGIPADKTEALRLFRLAVERGEDKAAKEVERLAGDRDFARGERDKQKSAGKDGRPRIRYVTGAEAGKHFGLLGVTGVAPPRGTIPEAVRIRPVEAGGRVKSTQGPAPSAIRFVDMAESGMQPTQKDAKNLESEKSKG